MTSIENKVSLSQQKFQKDFNRVIHEIYSTFYINYSIYIRNSFQLIKLKNAMIKLNNL